MNRGRTQPLIAIEVLIASHHCGLALVDWGLPDGTGEDRIGKGYKVNEAARRGLVS